MDALQFFAALGGSFALAWALTRRFPVGERGFGRVAGVAIGLGLLLGMVLIGVGTLGRMLIYHRLL